MSAVISSLPLTVIPDLSVSAEQAVRQQVWSLLSGLYPVKNRVERRAEQRFPYPYLVRLTPLSPDGLNCLGEPLTVAGKHLSERGLGFYHQQPLPYRRMMASLRGLAQDQVHFLIDVTWCRFTGDGWYDSGGRFLRTLPGPINGGSDGA